MSPARTAEKSRLSGLTRSLLPEGQFSRIIGASIALGIIVGFGLAVFEWILIDAVLATVLDLPLALQALSPFVGLGIAAMILKVVGNDCTPSTSDEYIRAFHSRRPDLAFRLVPVRLMSGIATIGFGGALGLEGPAIYAGSATGLQLKRRLDRWLGQEAARMLLTAGAAAGISAIFQAPATGVIFALESPYRDDVAHRALLPSLIASATSYITFIAMPFNHAEPLLSGASSLKVGAGELVGAVLLGVGAGFGGRVFAWNVVRAKRFSKERSPLVRVVLGGAILGALALLTDYLFDAPLSLGTGARAVDWIELDNSTAWLVLILFVVRAVATLTTVAAGGTGGLFIPLAVQGILLGHLVQLSLEAAGFQIYSGRIWPILGLAAFLAAGYRTPIAAVMFVAEATGGGSAAVVPALIAAAVSQLVAGNASVSTGQKVERVGHLEHRMTLPIASALNTEILTVPPDATISEFIWIHAVGRREAIVPVVDGLKFIGLCTVDECAKINRDEWDTVLVESVAIRDTPIAKPSWTIRDAVAAMDQSGWDLLPVVDDSDSFVGLVQASEIVKLESILDETGGVDSPF